MMNCVMVRWLCDRRVVFDIRVLKVYNFTFLLVLTSEMTPKKKCGTGKRSKKDMRFESLYSPEI